MCGAWVCVQPCFKEVTAVFLRVKQGLLAEKTCFQARLSVCLLRLPNRVESSRVYMYQSHITTAKEHCNHPACQTKQPRPKEPCNQPAKHGVGDLWRSATGFNTVQTCTMGLPWQRATKACPKLLVSSWPMGLRAENVGFSKQ